MTSQSMQTIGEVKIPVVMTALDAERFLVFQKYYIEIREMIDSGVFETKNGKAILSFNSDGKMMEIEIQQKVFRSPRGV